MPKKRYCPLKGEGGSWTLGMEKQTVDSLPVSHLIDCLILKIRNSNGLDFCSFDQVQCLMEELDEGYSKAVAKNPPSKNDPLREHRSLLIRALFSHLAVQFARHGGLYEVNVTLPAIRALRAKQGLAEMTDEQSLRHAMSVSGVIIDVATLKRWHDAFANAMLHAGMEKSGEIGEMFRAILRAEGK